MQVFRRNEEAFQAETLTEFYAFLVYPKSTRISKLQDRCTELIKMQCTGGFQNGWIQSSGGIITERVCYYPVCSLGIMEILNENSFPIIILLER